jgi:hypothetical protein
MRHSESAERLFARSNQTGRWSKNASRTAVCAGLGGRAEGQGFEPWRNITAPSGFQDRRHRPLGEPSSTTPCSAPSQRPSLPDRSTGFARDIASRPRAKPRAGTRLTSHRPLKTSLPEPLEVKGLLPPEPLAVHDRALGRTSQPAKVPAATAALRQRALCARPALAEAATRPPPGTRRSRHPPTGRDATPPARHPPTVRPKRVDTARTTPKHRRGPRPPTPSRSPWRSTRLSWRTAPTRTPCAAPTPKPARPAVGSPGLRTRPALR